MNPQDVKTFEKLNTQKPDSGVENDALFDLWKLMQEEDINVDVQKGWEVVSGHLPSKSSLRPLYFLRIAAAMMIAGTFAFLLINQLGQPAVDFSFKAEIDRSEINLPDGTEVTLAQGTKIDYLSSEEMRSVHLRGRAYFDVVKSDLPFQIETSNGNITVVGTSFEVQEDEKGLQVAVSSGKVRVTIDQTEKLITANQLLTYDVSKKTVQVTKVKHQNLEAWSKGYYLFKNQELGSIIELLERNHDWSILLENPQLEKCTITGKFDLTNTTEMINALSTVLGFNYSQKGNQLIINGKGC